MMVYHDDDDDDDDIFQLKISNLLKTRVNCIRVRLNVSSCIFYLQPY
jgi:hypothetical protein